MTLTTILQRASSDNALLAWHITHSGSIRRSDGACPLEAAAGTGPHSLWSAGQLALGLADRECELLSAAADMDWWPHRMQEHGIRKRLIEALNAIMPHEEAA